MDAVLGRWWIVLLRGRVVTPRRADRQAASRLSGVVERGDRQRSRRPRHGLLPLARAPQDRRRAAAPSPGRDGGRGVAQRGVTAYASKGTARSASPSPSRTDQRNQTTVI